MTQVGAGGANTFTPSFSAATGLVQTEFTRKQNSFPITRYARLVPCTEMKGFYLKIDNQDAARVVNIQDSLWNLGQDRPTGNNYEHEFVPFTCVRHQKGFNLPIESVKQAKWDIQASHARMKVAEMMTIRSMRAATALSTVGNYTSGTNYFATATALGAAAYTGAGVLKKIFQLAIELVTKNTNGCVNPADLVCIMNPTTARLLGAHADITDYVKNTGYAYDFLRGQVEFQKYGLPQGLFGVGGIVVDDTVRVSTKKGAATQTRGFFWGTSSVPQLCFVSRPGGVVGTEVGGGEDNNAAPSFDSVSIFAFEDMKIETRIDEWNRKAQGSVVDNSTIELTAPLSALFIADIAS